MDRFVDFFGLGSIFEYDVKVAASLFSRHRRTPREKMRDFWVRSAYSQFERRPNPNDFDESRLSELVLHIHGYTRYERSGLLTVAQALYGAGVTVIAQHVGWVNSTTMGYRAWQRRICKGVHA